MVEKNPQGNTENKPEKEVSHEDLFKRILAEHKIFEGIFKSLEDILRKIALGQITSGIYYNTPYRAIVVATPNPAPGFVTDPYQVTDGVAPGYQLEEIYSQLGRIAPKITIINDGSDTIYVIVSSDGVSWSIESPVIAGEVRNFYNVWNMGLRSPTAGNITAFTGGVYRLSEFDFSGTVYSRNVTPNRPAFTTRVVNAPVGGAILPAIAVPNGFSLVVTANPLNVGQVFVADTIANAIAPGVPGNRITLNAGDIVRLFITNANLVAVAGSAAGQDVDIVVEQ